MRKAGRNNDSSPVAVHQLIITLVSRAAVGAEFLLHRDAASESKNHRKKQQKKKQKKEKKKKKREASLGSSSSLSLPPVTLFVHPTFARSPS